MDAKWQTIYCWSPAKQQLTKVRDNPLDPVQLFFDKAGDLMVVSYSGDGTVYTSGRARTGDDITLAESGAKRAASWNDSGPAG